MDSVKIWILLLLSLSTVSAGMLMEDDVATPDGQVHEVARSDPGCTWQEINSTTADGETTTVFMDFTAGEMLFLNGSACEVRRMSDKEMAMQEYCHGQELQSQDDGEEQSEMDSEDFEEDDSVTVDLETLPVRMQGYCRGKVIHPMVHVASGEGIREKRSWLSFRCGYRCLTYRLCYRRRVGWFYITFCYQYRRCFWFCW